MLVFISYLVAVSITVLCTLYFYFTRTFGYWKKQNVVGPKPVPFFGNIKDTALRRKHGGTLMKEFYDMYPNEQVVGIYRMTTPSLVIRDLDIIKHIMIKDFDLFRDRGVNFSNSGLGQNMFHTDGDTWSALRTRFSPAFSQLKLKNMFHLLSDCSDRLVNYLESTSQVNTEFEVRLLLQRYTMSTIAACGFGLDLKNFEPEMNQTLLDLDKKALTLNYTTELDMMYPGLLNKLNISLFPPSVTQFFEQLVHDIFTQRDGKPIGRGDFMDLMLQLRQMKEISKKKLSDNEDGKLIEITDQMMAAQAFVFFLAGYETSLTTAANLFYQLALNPEIQDKLREEIDTVTKAHGKAQGEITYESLADMKYLDNAFLETIRMYPILDPLQRKAKVDYKIPGTDVIIKKGQIVLIPVLGIHHDKQHYPKPDVFDPCRFDPEVANTRHQCAYLPFGVGPRNCIGMRFGSVQTRLGIAKIISKFEIETSAKTQSHLEMNPQRFNLAPVEDIYLHIKPRKA